QPVEPPPPLLDPPPGQDRRGHRPRTQRGGRPDQEPRRQHPGGAVGDDLDPRRGPPHPHPRTHRPPHPPHGSVPRLRLPDPPTQTRRRPPPPGRRARPPPRGTGGRATLRSDLQGLPQAPPHPPGPPHATPGQRRPTTLLTTPRNPAPVTT